jgi:hypothetical protein
MTKSEISRDVASAVVWLDPGQVQQLLQLLLGDHWTEAQSVLDRAVPDLPEECRLTDARWREALFEELEFRLSPPDDEDPDQVATREVPDYTRFARVG